MAQIQRILAYFADSFYGLPIEWFSNSQTREKSPNLNLIPPTKNNHQFQKIQKTNWLIISIKNHSRVSNKKITGQASDHQSN
jgi:hypothetical protein